MKKLIFSAALVAALLAGCGGEEEAAPIEETPVEETTAVAVDKNEVIANAEIMTGSTFVKSVAVVDNVAVIDFYESYDAYKVDNPESNVTIEQYKMYFDVSTTIGRILVVESARLMYKTPELAGVKMTLPYDGKIYSIDLERGALTEHLGFNVGELVDNDEWNEKFTRPISDDRAKVNELLEKFGNVK